MDAPHSIMVATDLSKPSEEVVRYAVRLACALQARCIIAHAYHAPFLSLKPSAAVMADDILLQVELEARSQLEALRIDCGALLPTVEWRLVRGDARDAILQLAAAEHVDLLVVGSRGRGGAAQLLLGSVASYVVRHASCPVMVVPALVR
jgi:nucleotide-binding universal stress UspA family protein